MRKQQPEFELQKCVCEYLKIKYPDVLFLSDARAFLKLTIPQALRSISVQKPGFACPDLMIFEARHGYFGVFLELKAKPPFKRDGTLFKNPHLEAQKASIDVLLRKGYIARFAWDFDGIQRFLDWYLTGQETEKRQGGKL